MQTGTNELVSVDTGGANLGVWSTDRPAMSADGRFVAFDHNGIYVRDMLLHTTRTVTTIAGGPGDLLMIDPSGRYVAFNTSQSLLPSDTNGTFDVYAYDLQSSTLNLVSISTTATAGDQASRILVSAAAGQARNVFSDNGRYLVFNSDATNLVAGGGANGALYVRDLQLGTTTLVSVDSLGAAVAGQGESMSADGTLVAFTTTAQLLPSDTNSQFDVYVRNVFSPATTLVSGVQPFGGYWPAISRDGQSIVYIATGAGTKLALYRLGTQATQTIHTGSDPNYFPAISDDERFVTFLNTDATLAPNDTNGTSDVFLYDV